MNYVYTILCLSLVLAASGRTLLDEQAAGDAALGDVQRGPESPEYKVLSKKDAFELRKYENATWVVSFGRSRWFAEFAAIQAGFGLAKYFKGGNVEHKEIPKTIPVLTTILRPSPPHAPPHPPKIGSHPVPPHGKNGSYPKPHHPLPPAVVLAAFIPNSFKGEPPLPECRNVKILNTNATEVYVHEFGGWAFSWTVGEEIGHLAEILKGEGICPCKGKFIVATYDAPWKFFGRHNEVWWIERPEHHNDTDFEAEEMNSPVPSGFQSLDAEILFRKDFPEEFTLPELEGKLAGTKVEKELSSGLGLKADSASSLATEEAAAKGAEIASRSAVEVS